MRKEAFLLAIFCAPLYAIPIISGGAGVGDTRPAPYGFGSKGCNIPCSVSTGAGSAWAEAHSTFDPARLTMSLSTYVTATSVSHVFTYAYASAAVADGYLITVYGQPSTVEADIWVHTSGASEFYNTGYIAPQMSVGLGNTGYNVYQRQCPFCPIVSSKTLSAPVSGDGPVRIALSLSINLPWEWGGSFRESSSLSITALRFYDAEGTLLQPASVETLPLPESGSFWLFAGGAAFLAVLRQYRTTRDVRS